MKIKIFICVMSLMIGLTAACGLGETPGTNNAAVDNKAENKTAEKKDEKKAEFTGDVKFPFDFPAAGTTAKKGERVLVPSYNWLVDAMQKDPKTVTMIWYAQTMEEPGEEMSQIKFMSRHEKSSERLYRSDSGGRDREKRRYSFDVVAERFGLAESDRYRCRRSESSDRSLSRPRLRQPGKIARRENDHRADGRTDQTRHFRSY